MADSGFVTNRPEQKTINVYSTVRCRCPFYPSPFLRFRNWKSYMRLSIDPEYMSSSYEELMVAARYFSLWLKAKGQQSMGCLLTVTSSFASLHTRLDTGVGALCYKPFRFPTQRSYRVKAIDTLRIPRPSTLQDSTTITCSVLRRGQ